MLKFVVVMEDDSKHVVRLKTYRWTATIEQTLLEVKLNTRQQGLKISIKSNLFTDLQNSYYAGATIKLVLNV